MGFKHLKFKKKLQIKMAHKEQFTVRFFVREGTRPLERKRPPHNPPPLQFIGDHVPTKAAENLQRLHQKLLIKQGLYAI